MSLTENSNQVFLPGGCNRTQNLRFGPYTNFEFQFILNSRIEAARHLVRSVFVFFCKDLHKTLKYVDEFPE